MTRRRTQQARSAETQEKLIRATNDCLIELGYGRVTTSAVCKRAGVSQGALFKHFPTKADLVAHAVAVLYDQLIEDYIRALSRIDPGADPVLSKLKALWDLFQTPRLLAVYDLHTAARTDPDLKAIMAPKEAVHRTKLRDLGRSLFPEVAKSPLFIGGLNTIISAVQGAAVGSLVLSEPDIDAQRFAVLEIVGRQFLEAPPDGSD